MTLLTKNYNIVICPQHIQPKDVNDLIMSGMSKDEAKKSYK